jgi:uncharacterized protein (DUF1697 family)
MQTVLSLLRGVNVGGRALIRMQALRALYESLGLIGVQTFIQSGNVLFRTEEADMNQLASRIAGAIERELSLKPAILMRTLPEWREVVASNPFAAREDIDPSKLLVTFVARTLTAPQRRAAEAISVGPEVLIARRREVYAYYPEGLGQSKLTPALLERTLGQPGTGRNWNSVLKMLALAESLDA